MAVVLGIVALILLGAFWRFVLKGAVIVAVLVLGSVGGLLLWDRYIIQPHDIAARAAACSIFERDHSGAKPAVAASRNGPGWSLDDLLPPATKGDAAAQADPAATSFTFEQAMNPCSQTVTAK